METKLSVKRSIYILIDIIGFLYIIGALISGYKIGRLISGYRIVGLLGLIIILGGIAVTLCVYIRCETSIQKRFSKLLKRKEIMNLSTFIIKFLREKL
jgi:cadmium resistance protein CadD (predicted permease)